MSKSYGERIRAAQDKGKHDVAQAIRLERDQAWLIDDGRLTAEFRAAMRSQDYRAAHRALAVRQEASRKRIDGLANDLAGEAELEDRRGGGMSHQPGRA